MTTIFDGSPGDTASLLNVGRSAFSHKGIGLSANARALTYDAISSNSGDWNSLFSLAVGPSLTQSGLQTQILGLRARLPVGMLHESVTKVKEENADNGAAAASSNGRVLNTEA